VTCGFACSDASPPSEPAPDPETLHAALLEVLITTCEPETVMLEVAFTPKVDFAWVSTSLPLPVSFSVVPIFKALQCMITFALAFTSMSPDDSIFTHLFAESMMILLAFVLSTMVIFSAPWVSSKITRWPERDLISFVLFLPDSLFSTGSCFLLHTEPMTIGRLTSPCSNTTSS
jgi:hypothetical protein